MRPHDRTFDIRIVDTIQSSLRPDALFDLLADPQGCVTWHEHPDGVTVDAVEAAPGLALQGAELHMRGKMRGVPYRSRTIVLVAQRPTTYVTETEFVIDHPRALLMKLVCVERYTIGPVHWGSTVRYETQQLRSWNKGALATASRLLQKVVDSFVATSMTRRGVRMLLSSAERQGETAKV